MFEFKLQGARGDRAKATRTPSSGLEPRQGEWFVRGPLPGNWIGRAARLPGHAFHVGIAVWHAVGFRQSPTIKLDRFLLDRFGIKPDAARRGLGWLEEAGLIRTQRHAGRTPIVTLLREANDDSPTVSSSAESFTEIGENELKGAQHE